MLFQLWHLPNRCLDICVVKFLRNKLPADEANGEHDPDFIREIADLTTDTKCESSPIRIPDAHIG